MWSSCMSRNEQKEMVHLCRSLTLSNAPKEIKLMGLYPIVLAVRCLLLLWAFCESPCIKGLTVCIWADMLSFFIQSTMLQRTKCIWNSISAHNSKGIYNSNSTMNGLHQQLHKGLKTGWFASSLKPHYSMQHA